MIYERKLTENTCNGDNLIRARIRKRDTNKKVVPKVGNKAKISILDETIARVLDVEQPFTNEKSYHDQPEDRVTAHERVESQNKNKSNLRKLS